MQTGRKGGDVKRAVPTPIRWKLGFQRDILAAKVPPEECRVSTPLQAPKFKAPEPGRDAHVTSGCEKQQGFCLPRRG